MLQQLLTRERIVARMEATEHWPAILELVDHLVEIGKLSPDQRSSCLEALRERETMTSTGIGSGVAIPHAFIDDLEATEIAFGRSLNGIEFEALDCAPVRFVLLFLVPRHQHRQHLKTLAGVARTLSNCQIRRDLAQADSPAELLAILTDEPQQGLVKSGEL